MLLSEIAQVIRSKNAGPRRLTLDIIFSNDDDYRLARNSGALSADRISSLYAVPAEDVGIVEYVPGRAIKVVLPRPVMAGDPGDRDVYGAQQHTPLLEIEL